MKTIYSFFRSIQLTVALILCIAILAILSTFVPQGMAEAFYKSRYSPTLAQLILSTGFDTFFRSFLFLFPAVLFFMNLGVCTAGLLIGEFRGQRKLNVGPDLIHIGILLLLIGAGITSLTRQEVLVFAAEGDRITIPGQIVLTVRSLESKTYPDGRPKDWITLVDVSFPTGGERKNCRIEVNRPLRVDGVKVYQHSWRDGQLPETGLLVKRDRGISVVLISFFLICAGLALTYYRKLRRKQ